MTLQVIVHISFPWDTISMNYSCSILFNILKESKEDMFVCAYTYAYKEYFRIKIET